MAPYDFDAPDADTILRSSDGKEFRIHRLILSLTSPVFQGMFGLPQSTSSSEISIINIPESSDILQPFLQYLYPRSPPKIPDIATWAALYAIADKYGAEVVMDPLRDMLIPRFLETSPLRVYTLASHWGFEEEAKTASTRTPTFDITKDLHQNDAELMGGVACQQLHLLHFNHRQAAPAPLTHHTTPATVLAETPPIPSSAVPYDCDAPDADVIIRSSDGKELRIHQFILSLTSPVFQRMFGLPQSTRPSEIPIIDFPESSDILQPFLQYLYPRSPPKISDISMWEALYTIADKYSAEVVMDLLRDMLIPRFLETSPLRVYALASCWGFDEEAKIASTRTLTFDIIKDLHQGDAELMGGAACHRLHVLHLNRRGAAQALITNHPLPGMFCGCPPPDYTCLIPALSKRVALRPWLTAEELYEEAGRWDYPIQCGRSCRNAFKNMHIYFASLLKGMSELPQKI